MAGRFDTSKDPRFKAVPKHVRKVEVDTRFAHMFKDKRFVETPTVDSRGQRLKSGSGKQKLRDFYALEEDGAKAQGGGRAAKRSGRPAKAAAQEKEAEEEADRPQEEPSEEEEEEEPEEEQAEDEDDEDDEEEGEDVDEEAVAEVEKMVWSKEDAVPHGDATRRLAVMGCDWDYVAAADLLMMFRTYLQSKESMKSSTTLRAKASIDKVTVYPSDFGIQEMAKEATSGPQLPQVPGDVAPVKKAKPHGDGEEEQEAVQSEALRIYQMQRTKYYWALVECDSVATAAWLYDQMDGLEADGIAPGALDLRFVPDDLAPPHPPHSEASEIPKKYAAPTELLSALRQTRVKCTWDEAPRQRKKDLMKKKFTAKETMEMDLSAYLASSSGEEDPADAEALKQLARGGDEDSDFFASGSDDEAAKPELGDMEATFSTEATRLEEELVERAKTKGKKGVHTLDAAEPKSVWEQYLQKKKDKRRERRKQAKDERKAMRDGPAKEAADEAEDGEDAPDAEDLELLVGEEDDRGFNARGSQRAAHRGPKMSKKRKRALEAGELEADSFRVDTADPRIAAVFSSADFEIDPTNPEFRRTEGMGAVLQKKRQRKVRAEPRAQPSAPAPAPAPIAPPVAAAKASGGKVGGLQLFAGKAGDDEAAAAQPEAAGRKKSRAAKRKGQS